MTLETDIQRQILDWLKARNILHWRVPIGGVKRGGNGKRGKAKNPMTGHPDIAGVLPGGRYFVIEVKKPGKKPTPNQREWITRLDLKGALVIVATCIEDVEKHLNIIPIASSM